MEHETGKRSLRRWIAALLLGSGKGKALVSLCALAVIGSVGMLVTQALYTDTVAMAQVSVTGGTLDLTANAQDGPGATWTGTVSAAITNSKPGQEYTGTVNIKNNGSLPMTVKVSTAGVDAASCYKFVFRETAIVTGTGSATQPVFLTSMGTSTAEAGMVAVATGVTDTSLPDNGADVEWDTSTDRDEKTYTLTVRHITGCTTQSAVGTLDFTFNAAQI